MIRSRQPSTPHPQTATAKIKTPSGRAKLHVEYERPTPERVNIIAPTKESLSPETRSTLRRLFAGIQSTPLRAVRWWS